MNKENLYLVGHQEGYLVTEIKQYEEHLFKHTVIKPINGTIDYKIGDIIAWKDISNIVNENKMEDKE
ncbi:MAG: hypothetical protein MAG795_00003 [Candidatus Woesearchaeota archaeon]|nr:hypothetical protein [Candidatus Woesearchaeota archaeon]